MMHHIDEIFSKTCVTIQICINNVEIINFTLWQYILFLTIFMSL